MDLKRISDRAKDLVEKRGGSDSLKRDAEQLKGIAKGPGSVGEKAKAAVAAIKDPGADEHAAASPATAAASEPERQRAEEKVKGEARGKHADPTTSSGAGGQGAGKPDAA